MALRIDTLPPRYGSAVQIGRGGMGDIYRATDSLLGRTVAVKVLAERYAEDEAVRQRFKREALAAARLSDQPNVVTIFDVGEHDERPYIVMEYFDGGSLDGVVRERGAQPPELVFMWLEQAARALDAAHAKGVVHRDVKPGNLLLDREGNVHVADFGVASAAGMDSLTMTGTVLGTAGYLSPEQAEGARATPASDRYALGVVAFELLSGTRPFAADTATAEAAAHVNAPVPSISERTSLPVQLDAVFERALAKDPRQRYETGAELVAALRAALADAAGQTRTLVAAPVRRRPSAWPLFAALIVIGALGGALLAYVLTRGDDTPTAPRTVVITTRGRITTVERQVTVTTTPPTSAQAAPPASAVSGERLNDLGFEKMQAGDYAGALPLLEEAVRKLQGSGKPNEAWAKYNLAYTRYHLGNCDGVLQLLDESEAIQGHRGAIERLRRQAEKNC